MTDSNKHLYLDFEAYKRVAEPQNFRNVLVRVNYRNPSKGIEPNKSFLIKFFHNLMLGEHHELKNRYMLIGYSDVDDTHTSTHTSLGDVVSTLLENTLRLIVAIGYEEKSVKEMIEAIGLKNRPNFLEYSIAPAIRDGFVTMKYPHSPHHPRQKYLLTVKGMELYDERNKPK